MIDSEFCVRCGRPYALKDIEICDSCIKDMELHYKKILVPVNEMPKAGEMRK